MNGTGSDFTYTSSLPLTGLTVSCSRRLRLRRQIARIIASQGGLVGKVEVEVEAGTWSLEKFQATGDAAADQASTARPDPRSAVYGVLSAR